MMLVKTLIRQQETSKDNRCNEVIVRTKTRRKQSPCLRRKIKHTQSQRRTTVKTLQSAVRTTCHILNLTSKNQHETKDIKCKQSCKRMQRSYAQF